MSNKIKIAFSVVLSTMIAVALLEGAAFFITEYKSIPNHRLFVAKRPHHNCELDGKDSLFGYAPGHCETPPDMYLWEGLAFHQTKDTQDGSFTVLTLGGSTTDPVTMSHREDIGFDAWPRYLAKSCQAAQSDCRIVNGGRAAFASSQELMLLVRDGMVLKPNVVVSLNGINEFYSFKDGVLQKYPFITKQQREVMASLCQGPRVGDVIQASRFLPNTMALVRATQYKLAAALPTPPRAQEAQSIREQLRACQMNLGLAQNKGVTPEKVWRSNVEAMHALSLTMGAEYYVFLQPTLGVGEYVPEDDNDLALLEDAKKVEGDYGNYLEVIGDLYGKLREECAELEYCVDISDLFVGQQAVYSDARHPNRKGNALQAEAIWRYVEQALERTKNASASAAIHN